MIFKDQLHRVFELKTTPKKIISLVPSQTELLVDLGLEKHIVGVTKFCVHPKHLRKTTKVVGGTKDIKLEKIKALQPDIILCNKEENTKEIVTLCSKICPVHVSDIYSIDNCIDLIDHYGRLFSVNKKAEQLINDITASLLTFKKFINHKQSIRVAYFIWRDPWMVAANNTYINYILGLNKFENVFQSLERYPEIELQDLVQLKPDLMLLSSEPYPFKQKHIEELQQLLSNTIIKLVDGEAFSWYGSRLLKSFTYFKQFRRRLF